MTHQYMEIKIQELDKRIEALEQQAICPSAGIDCVDCPAGDDAIIRQAAIDAIEKTKAAMATDG